jgi:hypothetical protein
MASVDPLKYRGVFDFPHNQSANLLDSTAPSTSTHVTKFFGWTGRGKHTRYTGKPMTGSVLEQQAAWMSEWLRKGRYAGTERA